MLTRCKSGKYVTSLAEIVPGLMSRYVKEKAFTAIEMMILYFFNGLTNRWSFKHWQLVYLDIFCFFFQTNNALGHWVYYKYSDTPCMHAPDTYYFLPGESWVNADHGNLTGTELAKETGESTDQSCLNLMQGKDETSPSRRGMMYYIAYTKSCVWKFSMYRI